MPGAINKRLNEYVWHGLPTDYDRTPKAVYAAIAVSFAMILQGEGSDEERLALAADFIQDEWGKLHAAGVIPQRPLRAIDLGGQDDESDLGDVQEQR